MEAFWEVVGSCVRGYCSLPVLHLKKKGGDVAISTGEIYEEKEKKVREKKKRRR